MSGLSCAVYQAQSRRPPRLDCGEVGLLGDSCQSQSAIRRWKDFPFVEYNKRPTALSFLRLHAMVSTKSRMQPGLRDNVGRRYNVTLLRVVSSIWVLKSQTEEPLAALMCSEVVKVVEGVIKNAIRSALSVSTAKHSECSVWAMIPAYSGSHMTRLPHMKRNQAHDGTSTQVGRHIHIVILI